MNVHPKDRKIQFEGIAVEFLRERCIVLQIALRYRCC